MPEISFRNVDLPAPLWPINAILSPVRIVQLTLRRASTCAPLLDWSRLPPVTERSSAFLRLRVSLVKIGICRLTFCSSRARSLG